MCLFMAELNEKTKAMLKLIEEDADSFAQRAEMYYKKRPELVSMVEDFYRAHRSLAERYDQGKPDTIRLLKTEESPFGSSKDHHQSEKLMSFAEKGYDSYSENCDVEESVESEIDDPEHEEEENNTKFADYKEKEKVWFVAASDEVMKLRKEIERLSEVNKAGKDQIKQKDKIRDEVMMLREEMERLREENKAQKDELKKKDTMCDEVMMLRKEIERVREENRAQKGCLKQKDKEKIEVIRQLSSTVDVLKQENVKMRSFIAKEFTKKWKTPFEFNKLLGTLSAKMFNRNPRNHHSIVAL